MRYDFLKGKKIKEIEVFDNGITLIFDEEEWLECFTSFSISNSDSSIQSLIGKNILDVYYAIHNELVLIFEDFKISLNLNPSLWNSPEDVVYKNYKDPHKMIISIIE